MLTNLFKRAFDKRKADHLPGEDDAASPVVRQGRQGAVHVNVDALDPDEQRALYSEFGRRTDIPIYEGHVEHGYSTRDISDVAECPRCRAKTERRYASFIYATQLDTRVMLAPAGHFCTSCPCVIVDEDLITDGILGRQYRYQGVLGIDYRGKKEADFFRTWNGRNAVYVFDEDQRPLGIATPDSAPEYRPARPTGDARAQRKKRRRHARQSRKRNRKR